MLEWRLGLYSDSSGCSYKVFPALSLEEATKIITGEILKELRECKLNMGDYTKIEKLVESANKHDIKLHSQYQDFLDTVKKASIQSELDKLDQHRERLIKEIINKRKPK